MTLNFQSQLENMDGIYRALFAAGEVIYGELKKGSGLSIEESSNESGDDQIGLDVIADEAFFETLSQDPNVAYVVSEERPDMFKVSNGRYSVALDPLDGSKSALVGIPSGAIFGVWDGASEAKDFHGGNILSGGFFVFGMNLEVYFADGDAVYSGLFDQDKKTWAVTPIGSGLPSSKTWSINSSAQMVWDEWFRAHYDKQFETDGVTKPCNVRWYASMVSDCKRLVLQGGLFAYPRANLKGYESGHLRLVYEAIPISFLIRAMGGSSTNGEQSLLEVPVETLHQKTPVFIGETPEVQAIEAARRSA